ncbi:MAG: universal stress protein [Halobacteriaceae archaeon]
MDRALVVVDDTAQHRELLEEAGDLAEGVAADLVLVATMTEEEAEENIEAMERFAEIEHTSFGGSDVLEAVEGLARDVGHEVLRERDVDFDAVGVFVENDDHAGAILDVARKRDCDHVFLPGRRRSPTGKAIFGDTAQRVILNYDDPVTVLTG